MHRPVLRTAAARITAAGPRVQSMGLVLQMTGLGGLADRQGLQNRLGQAAPRPGLLCSRSVYETLNPR